jgi:hypothetical protein
VKKPDPFGSGSPWSDQDIVGQIRTFLVGFGKNIDEVSTPALATTTYYAKKVNIN